MKKRFFFSAALGMAVVLTVTTTVPAKEPTQVLSVNPVSPFFGVISMEYQQNIDKSSAWALRGLYWDHSSGDWKWRAAGAGGSYRGFFDLTAPRGGYIGIGADVLTFSAEYVTETASTFFLGPKVELGYRWLLGARKNLAIGVGGELRIYFGRLEIAGEKMPFGGIMLGIPVSIGFAW